MNAQQLKNSILQMAVQGKLVPQDPNDEPAFILVDSIRKQQKKLIQDKIIKKERYNPEIDYQEPLPEGWCYVKLGELTSIVTKQTGFDYSNNIKPNLSAVKLDGMIPMVQTKNFKGKSFSLDTDYYIPVSVAKKFPKILLDSKCLLLSIVGASIGNVGIYDLDNLAMMGGAICKVKLIDEALYEYLYYYFLSPLGQSEIKKNLKATAQGTITVQDVREIVVEMPPLSEQHRIVERLKEVLPLIDKYDVLESRLESVDVQFPQLLKKSILQQAVMGKLVPQDPNDEPASVLLNNIRAEKDALVKAGKLKKDKHVSIIYRRDNSHYEKVDGVERCIDDEIPFEIPANWLWTRFESGTIYTTDYVANGSFSSLRENVKTFKEPNFAIMIKTQDFANGFSYDLTYTDETSYRFLSKSELHGGELMLSNIGASIGKAFIIPVLERPMTLAPNSIVVKCINDTMTLFLKDLMLSFYGQQLLKDFTAGTAMPKFSKTQLRGILIPIPPEAEQKRILSKVEELFSMINAL